GKVITSENDQKRLLALGGVKNAIVTPVINTTREEAIAVARIARDRGWRSVILVTSPAHSGRACATFEKVGLLVSCAPSDSRDVALLALGNGEDRIAAFRLWVYETAGTLWYRRKGWL
ncbi:MAG: YdcF family protein, partial [Gemmatimonadaceae bacterium]